MNERRVMEIPPSPTKLRIEEINNRLLPKLDEFDSGEKNQGKIAVIGAGAFGTAMATVAARSGHKVILYARCDEDCDSINTHHRNKKYFSEYILHDNISATSDLAEAVSTATFIMLCIPCQSIPPFLEENRDLIPENTLIVNTAKGLHLKSKRLLSDAIKDSLGRDQPYALLSGPSFAKEIIEGYPSAVCVASKYLYHAVHVQRMLSSNNFRIFTSQDVIGVELGGALKNPLAIGAGMIEGLGFKINTMSAYVTRSSLELMELCEAMGGKEATISGLSGIGDLMLTCFGELSRNRTMGKKLTQGFTREELCKESTVEGVPTAEVAIHFADLCGLDLPIFRTVAALLNGDMAMSEAGTYIMGRPLSKEQVDMDVKSRVLSY